MRNLALAIAAVLSLALVAPVFAQPFADVPADHWAFDAIAELAAKGILEGYPDGTFKGDRAMTRYEMAMALARILARIEAIKIPPPPKIPPPEVRAADIARLQRLLNEFRAELSALGVRITAVEESLSALQARVNADTTRITGNSQYVYTTASLPVVSRNRVRLNIRGQVTGDFTVTARARWNSTFGGTQSSTTDFDRIVAVWASPWGLRFEIGRQYWALGPKGLLISLTPSREGAQVSATFGGISLTGLAFFNNDVDAVIVGPTWGTTYGARAEFSPISGWTFGAVFRSDRDPFYGTSGNGWSVDVQGDLFPGLSLLVEYASWNWTGGCPAPFGAPFDGCTALFAQLTFDLGALTGMQQFSPEAVVWYKDYRNGFAFACGAFGGTAPCGSTYSGTEQAYWQSGFFGGSGVTAWGASLNLALTSKLSLYVGFESGRVNDSATFIVGETYTALSVIGTYTLSRNATVQIEYLNVNNTTVGFSVPGWSGVVLFSW